MTDQRNENIGGIGRRKEYASRTFLTNSEKNINTKKNRFKGNQNNPLKTDVLIVDECSMLDISLTAALLKAVGSETALVFIGDAD